MDSLSCRRRRTRRRLSSVALRPAAATVLEILEDRRLLAFAVNVDFQPASATVPAGYLADSGLTYANRSNGFTYGWSVTNDTTRDRNATGDQKFDTLIHTAGKTWELSVPNGTYSVKLVAGDPSYFDSTYAFDAEGALALSGTPTSGSRFVIATKAVTVGDGKLTITNAAGAVNNKLAFLEITDADDSAALPSMPATIQAEDFDNGGANVSYFDTTAGNAGKQYRAGDVDIVADSGGGYAIGYTRPGEWLKYTFKNATAATFNLAFRVASGSAGGVFHLEIDGVDKTGPITLANTGGWQQWKTLTKTGVAVAAGQHTMRLVFDKTNGSDIGDIGWIKFSAATTPTVSIAATDNSASEPGTNTGKFTITRTGSTSASLLVKYVIGGSATNGTDYNSLAGNVIIPAGSSSATVTVTPQDDAAVEGNETVALTLSPITGHNLVAAAATVTIADNDGVTPTGEWPKSWNVVSSLSRARQEARGYAANGKLWLFGGYYAAATNATQQVDVYDFASKTWSKLPEYGPMPHTHSAIAADAANAAVYFLGGLFGDFPGTPTNKVFKFDTLTQKWSQPLPPMPENHQGGGAAIVNGKLHYFGGSLDDRVTDTGRHIVLDLSNPAAGWQTAPDLPVPRAHFSVTVLAGKIYAIGGQLKHDLHDGQLGLVHRYDPVSKTWERLADLPTAKSHAEGSTFVRSGKIIVAGGQIGRFGSTDEVVSYDPTSAQWTTIGKLPVPLQAGLVLSEQNKIIVTTGNRGDGSPRGDTWVAELD